jgi:O-antigen ligase
LKRNLLLLLGALATTILLLSRSRTMLISAVVFFTVVFGYLRPGRKVLALYIATVLLMLAVAVKPELVNDVTQTYILKSGSRLMESRGNQIQESLQSAIASGPLGLGFGISAGISRFWESGNFSSYSREKGNSILAVWEETGIIGAGLWLATMLVLALSLRRMGKDLARGSSGRFLYFVALGFLCGCCVSSMGEAWVLSPSPETAVFWATMGIGFGALKADANSTSSMGAAA